MRQNTRIALCAQGVGFLFAFGVGCTGSGGDDGPGNNNPSTVSTDGGRWTFPGGGPMAGAGHEARPWERTQGGPPRFPFPGGSGAASWLSEATTHQDEQVLISKVSYRSGDLEVVGQVCRPQGHGAFPVELLAHAGFAGLGADWNGGECVQGAREGRVVLEPSFRGQDGSQGRLEVCLGEVDDALHMLATGLAQPYANAEKVSLVGFAHGGCVALRALQRGAPVGAAVDVGGPTDLAALYNWYQHRSVTVSARDAAEYLAAMHLLETAVGGTPQTNPAGYAARSPARDLVSLASFGGALLVVHGAQDPLAPTAHSCSVATGYAGFHVAGTGAIDRAPPQGCSATDINWHNGPLPTTAWPDPRYLVVFDDVAHSRSNALPSTLSDAARQFLAARAAQ